MARKRCAYIPPFALHGHPYAVLPAFERRLDNQHNAVSLLEIGIAGVFDGSDGFNLSKTNLSMPIPPVRIQNMASRPKERT